LHPLPLLLPLLHLWRVALQVLDASEVPKDFGAIYKYVYRGADSHSSSSNGTGSSNGDGSSSSSSSTPGKS
jgi:hypothetical protein